jgi:hypothetical protein
VKIEFMEGFKILLIAETNIERIFLAEWERRSNVELVDDSQRDCRLIDPDFIKWEAE